MKAFDYEAVVVDDEVYCRECAPEEGEPIFAASEWGDEYPICVECGTEHKYMSLTAPVCPVCEDTEARCRKVHGFLCTDTATEEEEEEEEKEEKEAMWMSTPQGLSEDEWEYSLGDVLYYRVKHSDGVVRYYRPRAGLTPREDIDIRKAEYAAVHAEEPTGYRTAAPSPEDLLRDLQIRMRDLEAISRHSTEKAARLTTQLRWALRGLSVVGSACLYLLIKYIIEH